MNETKALVLDSVKLSADSIQLSGDKPTSLIQLAKVGEFKSARYGKFSITEAHVDKMVENHANSTTEPPVDYHHLSDDPMLPDQAIAAGWIKSVEKRADKSFWGAVEWTPKAAQHIRDGELRYVSPVIMWNAANEQGESVGTKLKSAALTNYPFLKGMAAVSLSELQSQGILITDVPLPADGGNEIMAAEQNDKNTADVAKLQSDFAEMQTKFNDTASKLIDTTSKVAALTADLTAERESSKKLREQILLTEATNKVEKLLRVGKLVPAQKEDMVELAQKDPIFFEKFVEKLPVVVKLNANHGTNDGDEAAANFSEGTDEDAIKLFEDKVAEFKTANPKVSDADAMIAVDKANPGLYEKRRNAFSRQTAVNGSNSVQ